MCFCISTFFSLSQKTKYIKKYFDSRSEYLKAIYSVSEQDSNIYDGLFREYYLDKSDTLIKRTGFYKNNIPIGKWSYYSHDQILISTAYVEPNKPTYWKYYFPNDSVKKEGYNSGFGFEGIWTYYYEQGGIEARGEYIKNLKNGHWEYFFEDGKIKAVGNYILGNGTYSEFYYNGDLKRKGNIKENESDGFWSYYYEGNHIQAKGYKHKGKKSGKWVYYYRSGKASASGLYSEGLRYGTWTFYHENGEISQMGTIEEGKKEGEWIIYDDLGNIKGRTLFENGNGHYKEFYEDGSIKVEGDIENNKEHGLWTYYDNNGLLEANCQFFEGRGYRYEYFPDGEVKMEGVVENGKKVGVWKLYNQDQEIIGYFKNIEDNKSKDTLNFYDLKVEADTIQKEVKHKEFDFYLFSTDTAKTVSFIESEYYIEKHINSNVKNIVYQYFESKKRELPDFLKTRKKPIQFGHSIRKIHYFKPSHKEYTGIIYAGNPLGVMYGVLPISVEYHITDRLGYQLQFTLRDSHFFRNNKNITKNELYNSGFSVAVFQKLYSPRKGPGNLYWSQYLCYEYLIQGTTFLSSVNNLKTPKTYETSSQVIGYGLTVGNRVFSRGNFTFDIYVGGMIGYRFYKQKVDFNDEELKKIFGDIQTSKLAYAPTFGFSFGYLF